MEYQNVENPKEPVYCHFCEREITRRIYVHCNECKNIDVCVECFANGSEDKIHKRTHSYRVFSKLDMTILKEGWKGYEELILLSGLEQVGYGNWEEIRGMLGRGTKEEVELHFKECYEDFFGSKDSLEQRRQIIESRPKSQNPVSSLCEQKIKEMEPLIAQAQERAKKFGIVGEKSGSVFGDVLGYMPLREEFDVEYDNDFELYLAEMEFGDEDTEEEKSTKFSILEMYNKTLVEREKRKKLIIEYNLLDLKAQLQMEKKMSESEKKIRSILRPFMRYMSKEEHEELVSNLKKEAEMRQGLELLIAGQQVGAKTLEELESIIFREDGQQSFEERLLAFNKSQGPRGSQQDKRFNRANPSGLKTNSLQASENQNQVFRDSSDFVFSQKALCEKLGMELKEFLLVKEFLVREGINKGCVDRDAAAQRINVDRLKFNEIFDFLVDTSIILPSSE